MDAIWRSEQLISLRERYQESLKDRAPSGLFHVVDELFKLPAINVTEFAEKAEVTKPTARKYIQELEKPGILNEYTGKERDPD